MGARFRPIVRETFNLASNRGRDLDGFPERPVVAVKTKIIYRLLRTLDVAVWMQVREVRVRYSSQYWGSPNIRRGRPQTPLLISYRLTVLMECTPKGLQPFRAELLHLSQTQSRRFLPSPAPRPITRLPAAVASERYRARMRVLRRRRLRACTCSELCLRFRERRRFLRLR